MMTMLSGADQRPLPGGGTPILDQTICAAQQGILLQKLCDRVSFSNKNYATEYCDW